MANLLTEVFEKPCLLILFFKKYEKKYEKASKLRGWFHSKSSY
jgi:hypothetical protein